MRMLGVITTVAVLMLAAAPTPAAQVVFTVKPIALTNGWRVTGTITTDGTVGKLGASNIVSWNLKVVQTTDTVWTDKDGTSVYITGASTDGHKLFVSTSPDGFQDGGALFFSRGGGGGRIATNAVIVDFTQLSFNLGYSGGMAGWQDEIGGLNYLGLNQRNHTLYRAGSLLAGQPNMFQVHVPTIATDPIVMTMFGTITTDGTIGPLLPQNLLTWSITERNQDITYYTNTNSMVLGVTGVFSNGNMIKVVHQGGQFKIGISGTRPTFVTLADFTDSAYPNGFANYYLGNYGVMGEKVPLVSDGANAYGVGSATPNSQLDSR